MSLDTGPNILDRNLEQLGASQALRRQLGSMSQDPPEVVLEPTESGIPRLVVAGTPVYHPTHPGEQAAQEVASFLSGKEPDLVVFFGLGLGLHARFLRLKTQAPILVFEPRLDVLARVLPRIPLDLDGVTLVTTTGHLVQEVSSRLSATRNNLAAGAVPAYRQIYSGEFESFRQALSQALRKIEIDQNTKALFATDWVKHLRDNLPALTRSSPLASLQPVFTGKPGILVGAGPSLDKNIDQLAAAQSKAVICAVHTAMRPLARKNIVPEITTIIEGHKLDYFFNDVVDLDRTYLAPDPQTHPCHLELGFKGLLPLNVEGRASSDWLQRAYGLEPLKSGGSVACAALSVLHHLGCDPIILVGMDAAFTHGRTHALDSDFGCCRVRHEPEQNRIAYTFLDGRQEDGHWDALEVEAWGGTAQVFTRPAYDSFRHWFEAAGQTWAADRHLINATEGGARFHGFQEMTLAKALERYAHQPVRTAELLKEAIAATGAPDSRPLGEQIHQEVVAHTRKRRGKIKEDCRGILIFEG